MAPSSSVTRLSGPKPSPVALRPSLTTGLPLSEESASFLGKQPARFQNAEGIET